MGRDKVRGLLCVSRHLGLSVLSSLVPLNSPRLRFAADGRGSSKSPAILSAFQPSRRAAHGSSLFPVAGPTPRTQQRNQLAILL
ncbi:hypothetical protein C4D60_Mb10t14660 [Musa balbisiana]|uniref:Uncharacterized protein n=1 Tax=Musa balbisiana TaxID=52838 RepID=A0A4S8IX33_MUSBA|nr:hypothetical protein C4D60_Mb10t14660 [Musa balbisiana]